MPRFMKYAVLVALVVAMVPPALIARLRAVNSSLPRVHLIQDMDNQPRYEAQHAADLFADGRAMRSPVPGTISRGELWEDDHHHRGITYTSGKPEGEWAARLPAQINVDRHLLERGRERFNIYCQPCHGAAGYGDGMVNLRGAVLTDTGINGSSWVAAKSLHEAEIREQPPGQVFNTITNGIRTMAGYASQIPVEDRWAIVAYVKALQRSQNASEEDAE